MESNTRITVFGNANTTYIPLAAMISFNWLVVGLSLHTQGQWEEFIGLHEAMEDKAFHIIKYVCSQANGQWDIQTQTHECNSYLPVDVVCTRLVWSCYVVWCADAMWFGVVRPLVSKLQRLMLATSSQTSGSLHFDWIAVLFRSVIRHLSPNLIISTLVLLMITPFSCSI
jgi:hypothetical protein